jgi:hypothetical protein
MVAGPVTIVDRAVAVAAPSSRIPSDLAAVASRPQCGRVNKVSGQRTAWNVDRTRGAIDISHGAFSSTRGAIIENMLLLRPRHATDRVDGHVGSSVRAVRFGVRVDSIASSWRTLARASCVIVHSRGRIRYAFGATR